MNSPRPRRILADIADQRTATIAELADSRGSHPMTVARCCASMEEDGYVRQITSGTYALTEAGERHLRTER